MLTLFSCFKPFCGPIAVIQRDAVRSWTLLEPKPEIILMGNEEGVAAVAHDFNVRHLPHVVRNEYGTPLVSSLFLEAEKAATHEALCYLNGDILLMNDFLEAVKRVLSVMPRCLMVGRRWNLDVEGSLDFEKDWEQRLVKRVKQYGRLYRHVAIDYFVFPKGIWRTIPPLAIGRPAWDNWILYQARLLSLPIVDLTPSVMVVHQNHDFSHHPEGWIGAKKGEESRRNIELAGYVARAHSLLDSQYALTRKGIRRRLPPYYSPFYLYRTFVVLSESHRSLQPLVRGIKWFGDRYLSHP